jgi:hypothetical protein
MVMDDERELVKKLLEGLVDERCKRDGITDEIERKEMHNAIAHEIEDCCKRILNLPYSNLEEQSAVLAMLAEHTYMQVMKGRDGDMNAEEISWLVNELQDSVQKLSKTVDRIIKHEKRQPITNCNGLVGSS